MKLRRSLPAVCLGIAGILIFQGVSAAEFGYEVGLGVGRSDNITRVPADEQSETISEALFGFDLLEQTRTLRARANADLAWYDYADDTYDSELTGNVDADALWRIVPERFEWQFEENFGQVRRDPFAAVTPDNRENVNFFTTGPDFYVGIGAATRLGLSGRYSNVSYEDRPLDNDRLLAGLSLLRNLSSSSTLSFSVQGEQIKYDDNPAGDFERREAFVGYEGQGSRTSLNVQAGYTLLDYETRDNSDGALLRVEVRRQISSLSTLSFRLGHEFSDAARAFRLEQGFGDTGLGAQSSEQSFDTFTNEYVTIAWDVVGSRTSLGASVGYFHENYDVLSSQDRERTTYDVYATRELGPRVSMSLRGLVSREQFVDLASRDFREINVIGELAWRLGRNLAVRLSQEYFDRSADLASTEYTENRTWLRLTYGISAAARGPASIYAVPEAL